MIKKESGSKIATAIPNKTLLRRLPRGFMVTSGSFRDGPVLVFVNVDDPLLLLILVLLLHAGSLVLVHAQPEMAVGQEGDAVGEHRAELDDELAFNGADIDGVEVCREMRRIETAQARQRPA